MDVIQLIGRLAFVAMFLNSGIAHFKNREGMAAYARSSGAPAPELLVPASGAMIFVGGALIALGVWPDVGALLIAAFLLPVAYFMHAFWRIDDPQTRQQQQVHFMKNLSLFGAALVMFACFADGHTGPALGGSLF
jgi:putative oxidoreductase